MTGHIALIGGASRGIGAAVARAISEEREIDEIWLVARDGDALHAVASQLSRKTRVFSVDLTREEEVACLFDALRQSDVRISWLIAAAGCGYIGNMAMIPVHDQARSVDLNCTAATRFVLTALPYLCDGAHILTVASAAAFFPQAGFGVYAATKAYMLSFTRALRAESRGRFYVTALCPGPVDTDFFRTAESYAPMDPRKRRFMISAKKAARDGIRGAKHNRAVVTPGFAVTMLRILSKILPQAWLCGKGKQNDAEE